MIGDNLLNLIEENMTSHDVSFSDVNWLESLPTDPGWYFFKTDTPPEEFYEIGMPAAPSFIHIPNRVRQTLSLDSTGILIMPKYEESYFVYSGEAANIRQRIMGHIRGPEGTFCLALSRYPILNEYKWELYWSSCNFGRTPGDSKLLRIFGEQAWRAKYGWPILCAK